MVRLNELHPETRLDLIEESHWQHGREHVKRLVDANAPIIFFCDWSRTRQGAKYWAWIDRGMPKHER
jgi:hypothetical protein